MIRSTLTDEELDLLMELRDACKRAIRRGLADSKERTRLTGLASKISPMVIRIVAGK